MRAAEQVELASVDWAALEREVVRRVVDPRLPPEPAVLVVDRDAQTLELGAGATVEALLDDIAAEGLRWDVRPVEHVPD